MADLSTQSIDISKIKVRWEEPYVSEASNKQMSAFPAGIYRGGQIAEAATPDQTFRIGPDVLGNSLFVDSLYVVVDSSNGFGLSVIDTADVSFDMSARFTGGGSSMPSDETWWVFLEVDYATSNPTEGTYKVTDTTPPDDAVIIGKIEMLSGDTTVTQARIDSTVRMEPLADKRKDGAYVAGDQWYGFLSGEEGWRIPTTDQKEAMDNAASPSSSNPFTTQDDLLDKYLSQPKMESYALDGPHTKFQITARVYVEPSKTGEGDFWRWLRVLPDTWSASDGDLPLRGSDGGEIPVLQLLRSDGVTVLQESDIDADGYYQNPYVELDFTNTSDSSYSGDYVKCFHFARQSHSAAWDEAPKSVFPYTGFQQKSHTNQVYGQDLTDSPDSLSAGTLTAQVVALLGLINDRVRLPHPETNPTEPQLVWRSHGITSDGSVTGKTSSLYVSNAGLYFVVGGYMNASGAIATAPVSSGDITMFWLAALTNGFVQAYKEEAAGGGPTTLDPATAGDWDVYTEGNNAEGFAVAGQANFTGNVYCESSLVINGGASFTLNSGSSSSILGDVGLESGGILDAKSGSMTSFLSGSVLDLEGTTQLDGTSLDLEGASGADDVVGYIKGKNTAYMKLLFEGPGLHAPKIYYSNVNNGELWIVTNAYYDNDDVSPQWIGIDDNYDATAIVLTDGRLWFYSQSEYEFGTGWTTWNQRLRWLAQATDKIGGFGTEFGYDCPVGYGDLYEQVSYAIGGRNVGTSSHACRVEQGYNFRVKFSSDPTNIVKVETEVSNVSAINFIIEDKSNWGFWLKVQSDNITENTYWYSRGYFHVYP